MEINNNNALYIIIDHNTGHYYNGIKRQLSFNPYLYKSIKDANIAIKLMPNNYYNGDFEIIKVLFIAEYKLNKLLTDSL